MRLLFTIIWRFASHSDFILEIKPPPQKKEKDNAHPQKLSPLKPSLEELHQV